MSAPAPDSAAPDLGAPITTALVSVSDKRGVVALCRALVALGVRILSTGGTARQLRDGGVEVTDVSDYTGFPEIMDGRVKTLHPKVHGGILARDGDDEVMAAHGIDAIGLVVANLYPFEDTVADPDCDLAQAIENIDIGGPAMLRAAAKNHRRTAVLVDADDYDALLDAMRRNRGCVPAPMRFELAVKAFAHTASYDGAIANYLSARGEDDADFPRTLSLQFNKRQQLRYGENPHQRAAFYRSCGIDRRSAGIADAAQVQGKELSFNNIADADAALECVRQFDADAKHACVIVKHANPCGVAVRDDQAQAYQRAFETDPESAFGGIIAFNQPLQAATARAIIEQQFVEVIAAPSAADDAKRALADKPHLRLLECGNADSTIGGGARFDYRRVAGGLLVQSADMEINHKLEVVTEAVPDAAQMDDLLFAWKVAKFVKSNAIVYARDAATIGVGAGQMSRVNSARIAAIKAQHAELEVRGAVMASDAFFPFRDGLDRAAEVGIRAVIQPGGSQRDDEVIKAADEHGIAMVFTAMRHFRH